VAIFLSDEWVAALDEAAQASKHLAEQTSDVSLSIQQVVRAGAEREVRYHVIVERGVVRVRPGRAASPDLTFTTDYESARAVACGNANVQQLLVRGRFKVAGRIDRVAAYEPVLDALDDVFTTVRATTSYPDAFPS
jgi:alkyl sulfatase BDS1-like metallo-beta-lactamase superfamily hydrolase